MNILKSTRILLVMIAVTALSSSGLIAQQINIEKTGGDIITEDINSIDNITFPDNTLEIHFFENPTEAVNLFTIKKIFFDLNTNIEYSTSNDVGSQMVIYPNPAKNFITIKNLPGQISDLRIYSLLGELMLQAEVSAGQPQIKVNGLTEGMYIVKIDGETLKLIKR